MGPKPSKDKANRQSVKVASGTGSSSSAVSKPATTSSTAGSRVANSTAPPAAVVSVPSTTSPPKPPPSQVSSPPESDPARGKDSDPKGDKPEKKPKKNSTSSPKGKADANDSAFSQKRLEELYAKYKDAEEDQIGPDGMTKLCADLEVDPADVIMLVIAYHLNAQRMGFFTKDEFLKGLQKMGVDSIPKLKAQFPALRDVLSDANKFKEIYRFGFNFGKEPDQKILDMQMGIGILELLMGDKPHAKTFVKFLGEQTSYKALNLDQWLNFLDFSRTIKQDFSNYDENSAWPVILDEYAAWSGKKK